MSFIIERILSEEYGITLFEKKNAPILTITIKTISGDIILSNGTPADLKANSSLFSPILPKSIMDDNKMAIGNDIGIRLSVEKNKSSAIVESSKPLPTKSSMYFHRN